MRNRLSLRALVALLVALTMFVAACSSSDDDSTEATSDDSTSSSDDGDSDDSSSDDEADDSSDTDDSGSDGDDDASSESSDDASDEDDMADEASDEDDMADDEGTFFGNEPICARWAENEALADEFDLFDADQAEAFLTMSRGLLDEAIGDAPGEIADDLRTIRSSFDELGAILEQYEWDFFAAAEDLDALDTAEADAANDRVQAWIEANCPDVESDDESSLTDDLSTPEGLEAILGSEAGRELFIDGMTEDGDLTREQAECLVDNLDLEMMSALALDPDSVGAEGAVDLLDVLAGCGIDINAFG